MGHMVEPTARVTRVITLGYKASAEQFAPAELLRFALAAEREGFDSVAISDHFQPFRHTGGHAPAALPWLGALAAGSERDPDRHERQHPDDAVPSLDGGSGVRDSRLPRARPRSSSGVGTGESMNEVPPLGIEWPGFKERLGRLDGGDRADQAAVDGGPGQLRRRVLPHPARDGL